MRKLCEQVCERVLRACGFRSHQIRKTASPWSGRLWIPKYSRQRPPTTQGKLPCIGAGGRFTRSVGSRWPSSHTVQHSGDDSIAIGAKPGVRWRCGDGEEQARKRGPARTPVSRIEFWIRYSPVLSCPVLRTVRIGHPHPPPPPPSITKRAIVFDSVDRREGEGEGPCQLLHDTAAGRLLPPSSSMARQQGTSRCGTAAALESTDDKGSWGDDRPHSVNTTNVLTY